VWESFGDVGFPTFEKVWREKKINKLSAKYNGSLAPIATLEQATIKEAYVCSKQIIFDDFITARWFSRSKPTLGSPLTLLERLPSTILFGGRSGEQN